jgi:hypothetical protein
MAFVRVYRFMGDDSDPNALATVATRLAGTCRGVRSRVGSWSDQGSAGPSWLSCTDARTYLALSCCVVL